jgi:transcriptional regulator with XRE-family HTH domain
MDTFHERLQEERKRLGLSQSEFGEAGGVQKRAQINYESGERQPDALYLQRLTTIGVDVLYVLTGKRLDAYPAPDGALRLTASESAAARAVNEREAALLENYRRADADGKRALEATGIAVGKPRAGQ